MSDERNPDVVVPYIGDCDRDECQDIFVYLRPETNGVLVESTIMRGVLHKAPDEKAIQLIYLANIPGATIHRDGILEQHYHNRIFYARQGIRAFSSYMKKRFQEHFGYDADEVRLLGAFEAMDYLKMDKEELFHLWVPADKIIHINGQSIKQYKDCFIINYDIPAILGKNNDSTDIAVMAFRTELEPARFSDLMHSVAISLREEGIVDGSRPFSRVFHVSGGPFEQIRDGLGFFYAPDGTHPPKEQIRFFRYLIRAGYDEATILHLLRHPIFAIHSKKRGYRECSIYEESYGLSYKKAEELLSRFTAQLIFP